MPSAPHAAASSASSDWFADPAARSRTCEPPSRDVATFHAALPGYEPTPLVELPGLAAELGVGRLLVKDESSRLGLPAFKILGASWGVHRALAVHYGLPAGATPDDVRAAVAGHGPVTLVTATDGNHGRAVARVARWYGVPARVLVAAGVHPSARAAIEGEGAEVTALDVPYDEAVRRAAASGGLLVQDMGLPGYTDVPNWICEGYTTLFTEIDERLGGTPGLVAVPVGVGSLAQAAVTHYRSGPAGRRPTLLAVEPATAASLLASLRAGRRTSTPPGRTIMAGLNCTTPSETAWPLLRAGVDAAVAVSDAEAARAVRDLAELGVDAGPCGAASLAGLRAALPRLPSQDTVVLLSTEGRAANPSTP
ncbi:pyridoxal-phosphate dependent enzyme [Actinomadura logoneensis]|uniref:Pyridoxal-phosphate dependent enzyme n=1 Tax=Actinomadura logoneensis TaxID=2293572 RepID=A0A372JI43_9ACTN|nr:pyridoxal-phosphate dependent enzyme [Actinomadura logoneensis]RFU39681.1 pyridoxal-phosphate dependent enzyme [Actinomadura logoneensis]